MRWLWKTSPRSSSCLIRQSRISVEIGFILARSQEPLLPVIRATDFTTRFSFALEERLEEKLNQAGMIQSVGSLCVKS